LKQLWGDIYYATKVPAPSGVMSADGVRVAGVRILAKHRTKEGLEMGRVILGIPDYVWGTWNRLNGVILAVKPYGQGGKEYFPVIEKHIERARKGAEKGDRSKKRILKSLEADYQHLKTTPLLKLKSIRSYIDAYDKELKKQQ